MATGFVKLLQMTVLPYVVISIIASLGSLSVADARRLGVRAGIVLVGLWSVGLVFALLMPVVFPTLVQGSFFSTSMLERPPDFDFVDLYIPSNPFNSLANNIVPAVVLFSIVLGVALISVPRKDVLLDVLSVARDMVGRSTKFVVRLTPYGMFAVAAVAAGTLADRATGPYPDLPGGLRRGGDAVGRWVLPGLVAALTPDRLRRTRALDAGRAADGLRRRRPVHRPALADRLVQGTAGPEPAGAAGEHAATLPDVIVPASFNFPHTGKLLSLSFVLFAGWFANVPIPFTSYPALAFTGLLTFFGSLSAAVPFLLDVFRIPADTFQLFLATGVINQRFGSLLAAVHTVVVGVLGSAAIAGAVRFDVSADHALPRHHVLPRGRGPGFAAAPLRDRAAPDLRRRRRGERAASRCCRERHSPTGGCRRSPAEGSVLASIKATGTVRACYLEERPPYAFINRNRELVGLDIEMAHQLANDLQVRLQLVPTSVADFANALAQGRCDIGTGGIVATPGRAAAVAFSTPYMQESLAFVVPDHLRDEYDTWDKVRARRTVRIGFPDVPYFRRQLEQRLPEATLVPVPAMARCSPTRGGHSRRWCSLPNAARS